MSIASHVRSSSTPFNDPECHMTISMDTWATLIPALRKVIFNGPFGSPCDHEVALTRELLKALAEANS